MKAGIVFTHNRDFMYVGPMSNGLDKTDAVIAWADNKESSDIGPDVLRFLFTNRTQGSTTISSNVFDDSDYDGVELGRMIGYGHTGLGSYWTNHFAPQRTLDVIKQTNDPQFRITRQRSANVNSGTNTDFQLSEHGNLHIIPRINGGVRAVAIGFFDDPSNNTDPLTGTFLDVGKGRTRLRKLPKMNPNTLVIGYQFQDVNEGPEDYFLGRLDFPEENQECFVLNGEGQWINICDGIFGSDCRWSDIPSATIPGEKDIRIGYDPVEDECYRGKVSIGDYGNKDSKLMVLNLSPRDKVKTGIVAYSLVSNLMQNVGIGMSANSWGYPQDNLTNTYFGIMSQGGQGSTTSGKFNIGVYSNGIANIDLASINNKFN